MTEETEALEHFEDIPIGRVRRGRSIEWFVNTIKPGDYVYSHPPRTLREWQGLEPQEITLLWSQSTTIAIFARAIENALKERNT